MLRGLKKRFFSVQQAGTDNTTAEQKAQILLFLLSCEDPKYPKHNFYKELLELVEKHGFSSGEINATPQRNLSLVAENLASRLVATGQWAQMQESWYSSDIAEALKRYLNIEN